jgi:hypothetical protein
VSRKVEKGKEVKEGVNKIIKKRIKTEAATKH